MRKRPPTPSESAMGLLSHLNLGRGFQRYFQIEAATNETTRDDVFRIRHEVYCQELQYEPVRPDLREHDAYDAHSLHCLLQTRSAPNELVGCVRLVLTNPADRDGLLPFEALCADTIDRRMVDPSKLPRERIAEVSRLAVRQHYRRRKGEAAEAVPMHPRDFANRGQPRFPYIPVGLYLGAVAMAHRHGIDTLFVLTEPRLAKHFSRLGVKVQQIGGPIDHRGLRVPSLMDVNSIISNMRLLLRPMWREVLHEIDTSLQSKAACHQDRTASALTSPRRVQQTGRSTSPALWLPLRPALC